MKDQNLLAQAGHTDFTDVDYQELGVPSELIGKPGLNRFMFDKVHAENVAYYIESGYSESQAKHFADERRSKAMKAAKANGLKL